MKLLIQGFYLIALSMLILSCSDDEVVDPGTGGNPGGGDPMTTEGTIWTGSKTQFVKDDGGDPTDQSNQDRLTDKVWITRGNEGGQIYNIAVENSFDKNASPAGTQWAIGTTSDLQSLTFANFRSAVEDPKAVVGKDLVLFLVEDNIYVDVQFTSWSTGKDGGFSYERSTP